MSKNTLDIFITHAWYFHEDWSELSNLLTRSLGNQWRNFSVPWHDPAMVPHTEVGKQFILNYLESQIIPVDVVILLYGVFNKSKSFKNWLEIELEFAKVHHKPVIGIPASTNGNLRDIPDGLVDFKVDWNIDKLVETLVQVSGFALKV